jgi:hypothetical protein
MLRMLECNPATLLESFGRITVLKGKTRRRVDELKRKGDE